MIPIDRQIQQRMAAVGNSPDRAMQTFRQKGDVLDLMVLEQLVSERKQANMDNMRRQGIDPTTVFDQKMTEALGMVQGKNPDEGRSINEVTARTRDTLNQQQNIANARARQAGVTQPPKMGSAGGVMKMAGGGIVGFTVGGSVTQTEIEEYRQTLPPKVRNRRGIEDFIKYKILEQRKTTAPRPVSPTPYSPMSPSGQQNIDDIAEFSTKENEEPKTVSPVAPKNLDDPNVEIDDSAAKTETPLPMLKPDEYTLGKGGAKTAMLDSGIGEIVKKDLELNPEAKAAERRTQVADSIGRAEGIETLGRQVREKQALTNKLYTDEQRALDKKRDFVIGASGRASTVGGGVAAAMKAGEAARRAQQIKHLDDIQELERKGITYKKDTGVEMEASFDKTLKTYYDAREASMDAMQNATAQELATARSNAQIASNIAIQNNRTLNGDLDRNAELQLEESRAAREDKRYSRQERYDRMAAIEKQLSENNKAKEELYAQEELKYAELADLEGKTDLTPKEQAKLEAIRNKIRNDVNARLGHKTLDNGTMSIIELEANLVRELQNLRKQTYTGSSSATGTSGYGQLQVTP